jgi:hypothetical protein
MKHMETGRCTRTSSVPKIPTHEFPKVAPVSTCFMFHRHGDPMGLGHEARPPRVRGARKSADRPGWRTMTSRFLNLGLLDGPRIHQRHRAIPRRDRSADRIEQETWTTTTARTRITCVDVPLR